MVEKALALNPIFPNSYVQIGDVYRLLDDYPEAEHWYNRALGLQPDLAFAHGGLILIYLAEGKPDRAVAQSQALMSIAPDEISALDHVGFAELVTGNYEQARGYYERALETFGTGLPGLTSISTPTRLAYIYWKTDRREKAGEMFSHSLSLAHQRMEQETESAYVRYEIAAVNATL